MAKFLDVIFFTLGYFLVAYGLVIKILPKKITIIVVALTYLLLLGIIILKTLKPKTKEMHPEETPIYLALMPRQEQTALFYGLVPSDRRISINSPYFLYEKEGKRVLVATLYRFLNLTQEDIASAYREGVNQQADEIIILTRARERKTLTLTALLPIKFTFPDKYSVHRLLKKHNTLPPKPEKPPRVKIKVDKNHLFSTIFNPKRAKLYMFSAISLALLSFITPLKNYYLIASLVPFILGIISYLFRHKTKLN